MRGEVSASGTYTTRALAAVLALTMAVSGCGGDDASTPNTGTSPTPTATPTPTQSPGSGTIADYPPFGVTANTQMQVVGVYHDAGGLRWLDPEELNLVWRSSAKTFFADFTGFGSGRLIDDPGDVYRAATFLSDAGGSRLARAWFFVPEKPQPSENLTLKASYGPLNGSGDLPAAQFFYFPKSERTMRTTGQGNFLGGLYAGTQSSATLAIDYATGVVTGSIEVTWYDDWGPYPETVYPIVNGKYDSTTGQIWGEVDIAASGFENTFKGQVLGSDGKVVAVVTQGAVLNPYDAKWERSTHFATFTIE